VCNNDHNYTHSIEQKTSQRTERSDIESRVVPLQFRRFTRTVYFETDFRSLFRVKFFMSKNEVRSESLACPAFPVLTASKRVMHGVVLVPNR